MSYDIDYFYKFLIYDQMLNALILIMLNQLFMLLLVILLVSQLLFKGFLSSSLE